MMVRLSYETAIELNDLLKKLRNMLPDASFRYSSETGLLEEVRLQFENDPTEGLNFFASLPRSYPSLNLLRKGRKGPGGILDGKPESPIETIFRHPSKKSDSGKRTLVDPRPATRPAPSSGRTG